MRTLQPTLIQSLGHHPARQPLTKAHHQVIRTWRQLTHSRNPTQQIVQRIELLM